MRSAVLKRVMDITGAVLGLVLLSPVMLVVAVAIRFSMGSPVLFRQVRPGLHGKPFAMYKFRTMLDLRDEQGVLLPDGLRLTGLGRFLRKTSLDELPELFNVLRGDMSLVGPRPLLMEYLSYYTEREQLRHTVRPGITGLAQVSGRNRLSWDDRLELDVQYVERYTIWLDIRILATTMFKVIKRKDVIDIPGRVQQPLSKCRQQSES